MIDAANTARRMAAPVTQIDPEVNIHAMLGENHELMGGNRPHGLVTRPPASDVRPTRAVRTPGPEAPGGSTASTNRGGDRVALGRQASDGG
jgi:hypothetical protein